MRDRPDTAADPASAGEAPARFDAVLLVSFGGPEAPDEVWPFLRNVTRGRGVPDERLAEVAEHYQLFGGRSPINDQNRALLALLDDPLEPRRLYWGNRNSAPFLAETVAQMAADGIRSAAVFVTAAYASYSSCRQYREDLAGAIEQCPQASGIGWYKLRHFYNHPGFVEAQTDRVREALAQAGPQRRPGTGRTGTSCTRAGPGRLRCRGSAPTSSSTWRRWPTAAFGTSSSCRAGSSATTSRWRSTSTSRPWMRPGGLASGWCARVP